jgi:hypothetical protein
LLTISEARVELPAAQHAMARDYITGALEKKAA